MEGGRSKPDEGKDGGQKPNQGPPEGCHSFRTSLSLWTFPPVTFSLVVLFSGFLKDLQSCFSVVMIMDLGQKLPRDWAQAPILESHSKKLGIVRNGALLTL